MQVGNSKRFQISQVNSPGQFFVVELDHEKALAVSEFVNELWTTAYKPKEGVVGQIILVEVDGCRSRGRLLSTLNTTIGRCKCFLLDKGYEVHVDIDCCRICNRIDELSYMSIACRLDGVTGVDIIINEQENEFVSNGVQPVQHWSAKATTFFEKQLESHDHEICFVREVLSTQIWNPVKITLTDDGCGDMAEMMCSEGLAMMTSDNSNVRFDGLDTISISSDEYFDVIVSEDEELTTLPENSSLFCHNCHVREVKSVTDLSFPDAVMSRLRLLPYLCHKLWQCWEVLKTESTKTFAVVMDTRYPITRDSQCIKPSMLVYPYLLSTEADKSDTLIVVPTGERAYDAYDDLSVFIADSAVQAESFAFDSYLDISGTPWSRTRSSHKRLHRGSRGVSTESTDSTSDAITSESIINSRVHHLLNGFRYAVVTVGSLKRILEECRVCPKQILFEGVDTYSEVKRKQLSSVFLSMQERCNQFNSNLRRLPRFIFHMNQQDETTTVWLKSVGRIAGEEKPLFDDIGWILFSALDFYMLCKKPRVFQHQPMSPTEKDDCIAELLLASLSDKESRTVVVCETTASKEHVFNVLAHNIGGCEYASILTADEVSNKLKENRFDVMVIYDVGLNRNRVDQCLMYVGTQRLRAVHLLNDIECVHPKSMRPAPTCPTFMSLGSCDSGKLCKFSHSIRATNTIMWPLPIESMDSRQSSSGLFTVEKANLKTASAKSDVMGKNESLSTLVRLLHESGENKISLRVRSVQTPSIFYATLREHCHSGHIFELTADAELQLHMSSNCSDLESLTVERLIDDDKMTKDNDFTMYGWKQCGNIYRRVKLIERNSLTFELVDVGSTIVLKETDTVYILPERFRKMCPAVIKCVVCNLKSADNEQYWPIICRRIADQKLNGKVLEANVQIIAENTIWLTNLVQNVYLEKYKMSIKEQTFEAKMISSGVAISNPSHLVSIRQACGVVEQVKSRIIERPPVSLDIPNGTLVIVSHWEDPEEVYLQRSDFNEQFQQLNMELTKLASLCQDVDYSLLSNGEICLATDEQSPKNKHARWYRCEMMDSSQGLVRLIDYGCKLRASRLKLFTNVKCMGRHAMATRVRLRGLSTANTDRRIDFHQISKEHQFMLTNHDQYDGSVRLMSVLFPTEPLNLIWLLAGENLVDICVHTARAMMPDEVDGWDVLVCLISSGRRRKQFEDWQLLTDLLNSSKLKVINIVPALSMLCVMYSQHTLDPNVKAFTRCIQILRDAIGDDPLALQRADPALSSMMRILMTKGDNNQSLDDMKTICADFLLDSKMKEMLLEYHSNRKDESRIISLFSAAMNMNHTVVGSLLLKLIPRSYSLSFDGMDKIKTIATRHHKFKELSPEFKQCMFWLETKAMSGDSDTEELKLGEITLASSSSAEGSSGEYRHDSDDSDVEDDESDIELDMMYMRNLRLLVTEAAKSYKKNEELDTRIREATDQDLPKVDIVRDGAKRHTFEDKSLKPKVTWHQDIGSITLHVAVTNPAMVSVIYDNKDISFRCRSQYDGQLYGFNLVLFGSLSRVSDTSRADGVFLELDKKLQCNWPRLTKNKKPYFVVGNVGKLANAVSDDESASVDPSIEAICQRRNVSDEGEENDVDDADVRDDRELDCMFDG